MVFDFFSGLFSNELEFLVKLLLENYHLPLITPEIIFNNNFAMFETITISKWMGLMNTL